jgi:methylmalonyl-CoA mutase N-terminal domain/subunit
LTAQQVDNNIVRVTIQTLAAVLGGAQSLHTNSRDEALALPTEESVRIALRTQQIVAHESGVVNTVDPLGGSYYIETLTDRIQREAEEYIANIDGMGGMVEAIEAGYVQTEIQKAAYRFCQEMEQGKRIVVGVNKYRIEEEQPGDLLRISKEVQEEQVAFLRKVRAERSNAEVTSRLAALQEAARGDANLMPYILDAVRSYAGVGEICDALRSVFGEHKERIIV